MKASPRSSLRPLLSLGSALLFAALIRAPIAEIPLERDEGEYAYIAQRWIAGEVPYRDAFDQKPPGIFLVYAVILRTLGDSPTAIHWGAQIWSFGTVAAVWALARAAAGNAAGAGAGILFSVLSASPSVLGNAANTETFMILPATLSLLAALRARRSGSRGWALTSGALAGAAMLFKQVAATNALLSAGIVAVSVRGASTRAEEASSLAPFRLRVIWRQGGGFLLGGALAWAPFLAAFASAGALRELWDCVAGYNLDYANSVPWRYYARNFIRTFGVILALAWPAYLLAAAGLTAWLVRPERRRFGILLGAWLAASAAGTTIGGYFRPHYYIQTLPAIAVLAALGARALADLPRRERRKTAFLAALLASVGYPLAASAGYWLPGDPAAKSREIYPGNPFDISEEVGRFLAGRTHPGDRIFILGSEPQIFFHANRKSATRYIFVYPLMTPTEKARARQLELIEEVHRAAPRIIVTVFIPTSFLARPETTTDVFDATRQRLAGYRLVALALRGAPPSGGLLTGAAAREAWRRAPAWYDRLSAIALAIWERR